MFKIIPLIAFIASTSAAGINHLIPPSPSVATYGGSHLLSGIVGPIVGPSVLSAAAAAPLFHRSAVAPVAQTLFAPSVLAHQHVTVARPAAVAVERVSYGSVPQLSVVNEPTTIVRPGKTIRGHSFTSEVRHDSLARYAAPLITAYAPEVYAAPAYNSRILEAPAVSTQVIENQPILSHLRSDIIPSTYVSSPEVIATGIGSVVAGPTRVKGYSTETGRTELVNEVRHSAASIPATVVQDTVVESAPALAAFPNVLSAPLFATHWK